jgi:hypothetical protein
MKAPLQMSLLLLLIAQVGMAHSDNLQQIMNRARARNLVAKCWCPQGNQFADSVIIAWASDNSLLSYYSRNGGSFVEIKFSGSMSNWPAAIPRVADPTGFDFCAGDRCGDLSAVASRIVESIQHSSSEPSFVECWAQTGADRPEIICVLNAGSSGTIHYDNQTIEVQILRNYDKTSSPVAADEWGYILKLITSIAFRGSQPSKVYVGERGISAVLDDQTVAFRLNDQWRERVQARLPKFPEYATGRLADIVPSADVREFLTDGQHNYGHMVGGGIANGLPTRETKLAPRQDPLIWLFKAFASEK